MTQTSLIALLAATAAVAALLYFGVEDQVIRLLRWLDSHSPEADLLFVLLMCLVVLLLMPTILLTTGAGFVFGIAKGSLLVVIGTTLGAILAFTMARYLFGDRASQFLLRRIDSPQLPRALQADGLKIVLFSRLLPFFPFKLSNYFFGLMPLSLKNFSLGTLIGIIPLSLHNVYLGAIAADLNRLMNDPATDASALSWLVYLSGFFLVLTALLGLTKIARKVLSEGYQ